MTHEEQAILRARVAELSAGVEEPKPCWFIDIERDEVYADDYCYECAQKKVDELLAKHKDLEGAPLSKVWSDRDSTPYCETCGCDLDVPFTNYGIEQEIEHFEQYWFEALDHPTEWAALGKVLDALMYDDDEKWDRIAAILELREPGIRTSEAPPDFLDGAIA